MDLRDLVNQLSPQAQGCLNLAVNMAVEYHYQQVCIEHMLLAINECQPELIAQVYQHNLWLTPDILADIMDRLTRQDPTSETAPVLSPLLITWLEVSEGYARDSWQETSLSLEALLYTLLSLPQLSAHLHQNEAPAPAKQALLDLEQHLKTREQREVSVASTKPRDKRDNFAALSQFTHNLTRAAECHELDPIPERDKEIRQIIDVLLRRRQNNPLLAGEPGVGKTALIEGLAQRIVAGQVPSSLLKNEVLTLDLGLLQAGASVKGVFEKRLQDVIKEIKAYPKPVILFIDEAHMLIGAGGNAGQADAANLLKPILARGELRIVAATTWAEYKKYFEKDAALARRFQVINVPEPTLDAATAILRALVTRMEAHHQVKILDEAVTDTINLAARYITGRQFPDKAVSLLDTACARVKISQSCEPAVLEELRKMIRRNECEQAALQREPQHEERLALLQKQLNELQTEREQHCQYYEQQQQLVQNIHAAEDEDEETRSRLRAELKQCHRTHPYVFECVDSACIADVVSGWTGIPLGRMLENERDVLKSLENRLEQRVFGQAHALSLIARQIRIAKSQLADPVKPVGVFMLVGPSGVGKTETALALAAELYGGEQNLLTINMSEYQEPHSVSGLKGSPPGYVGYGEGGTLTEAVRRQPYSVVLLDEIEKAHPDVLELFYQVFDKGEMEDAEGVKVNFRNILFLLTSNMAANQIKENAYDETTGQPITTLNEVIMPVLEEYFTPAFVGRMQVIPYLPVNQEMLTSIIRNKLNHIIRRYHAVTSSTLYYDDEVVNYIATLCNCNERGAREIDNVITTTILPILSERLLFRDNKNIGDLTVSIVNESVTVL
ncbi:type VI secretion system ATPase TssH [Enterobacteriaceae bacterium LUAb1]